MAAGLACKSCLISTSLSTFGPRTPLTPLSNLDDLVLLFWRVIINIFFREIRPRGAFNIPRDGPVLFICGPHANQFLDPLLLFSEVRKEAHRRVAVLIAAKVG